MENLPLDFSFLPPCETVLVACSGGADSIALLLALRDANYPCVGAHIHHGTRGKESDGDENFVRTLCEKLQIPFASARLNLPDNANEAAMRDARYSALLGLALEYSSARIATGHNANDSLETVLLNWLRGASVSGQAGIAPARELGSGVLLARPMLSCTRENIRDFLNGRNQIWREDSSNADLKYARNRVRRELIPVLNQLIGNENQLALQTLEAGRIWRGDVAYLEEAARASLQNLKLCDEENLLILDGARFRELPVAMQRRILRLGAQHLENDARDLSLVRVEEVRLHVLENRRRAVWQWRKNLRVEWTGEYSGNRLRFMRV